MELLTFILAGYGLTQILVYSSLFSKPRKFIQERSEFFGELSSCPMCMGFWVGALLFCLNPFTELFTFELGIVNLLICGWLCSGTSYILNMVFGDKGMTFFHNHSDSNQGCENCSGNPYHNQDFDEMAFDMFEYGGDEDEQ